MKPPTSKKKINIVRVNDSDYWLIIDPVYPDRGYLMKIPEYPVILDPLEYTFADDESLWNQQ